MSPLPGAHLNALGFTGLAPCANVYRPRWGLLVSHVVLIFYDFSVTHSTKPRRFSQGSRPVLIYAAPFGGFLVSPELFVETGNLRPCRGAATCL
jgi:hypothetical protein